MATAADSSTDVAVQTTSLLPDLAPQPLSRICSRGPAVVDGDALLRWALEADQEQSLTQQPAPVLAIVASVEQLVVDLLTYASSLHVYFQAIFQDNFIGGTAAPQLAPYRALRTAVRAHLVGNQTPRLRVHDHIFHLADERVWASGPAEPTTGGVRALQDAGGRIAIVDLLQDTGAVRTLVASVKPTVIVVHSPNPSLGYSSEVLALTAGHTLQLCAVAGKVGALVLELGGPAQGHPTGLRTRSTDPAAFVRQPLAASSDPAVQAALARCREVGTAVRARPAAAQEAAARSGGALDAVLADAFASLSVAGPLVAAPALTSPRLSLSAAAVAAALASSPAAASSPVACALMKAFLLHVALLEALPLEGRTFLGAGCWDAVTDALAAACMRAVDAPLAAALTARAAGEGLDLRGGPSALSVADGTDARLLRVCIQVLRQRGASTAPSAAAGAGALRAALGLDSAEGLAPAAACEAALAAYTAAHGHVAAAAFPAGHAGSAAWASVPFAEAALGESVVGAAALGVSLEEAAAAAASAVAASFASPILPALEEEGAPPAAAAPSATTFYLRAALGSSPLLDALRPYEGADAPGAGAAQSADETSAGGTAARERARALLEASSDPTDILVGAYKEEKNLAAKLGGKFLRQNWSDEKILTYLAQRRAKRAPAVVRALFGQAIKRVMISWEEAPKVRGKAAAGAPAGRYRADFVDDTGGKPKGLGFLAATAGAGDVAGAGAGSAKDKFVADNNAKRASEYVADSETRWANLKRVGGKDAFTFALELEVEPYLPTPELKTRLRSLGLDVCRFQLAQAQTEWRDATRPKARRVKGAAPGATVEPPSVGQVSHPEAKAAIALFHRCVRALDEFWPSVHASMLPPAAAPAVAGAIAPAPTAAAASAAAPAPAKGSATAAAGKGKAGSSKKGAAEAAAPAAVAAAAPRPTHATAQVDSEAAQSLLALLVECFAQLGFADSVNSQIVAAVAAAVEAAPALTAGKLRRWQEALQHAASSTAPVISREGLRLPEPQGAAAAAPARRPGTCSMPEFQLSLMGPYLQRPRGAGRDERVSFQPDVWQRKLLDAVDADHSILVVAPTSAGKTFICHHAIKRTLAESDDGIVVYVAPTKALVQQFALEVQTLYDKRYVHARDATVLGMFTGDERFDELRCQVLVTVPQCLEVLLLSIAAAGWAHRVKRLVVDEVHNAFQAPEEDRAAPVWERLLHLTDCQYIALSATVGDDRRLVAWLSHLESQRRPGRGGFTFIRTGERFNDLAQYVWDHDQRAAVRGRDRLVLAADRLLADSTSLRPAAAEAAADGAGGLPLVAAVAAEREGDAWEGDDAAEEEEEAAAAGAGAADGASGAPAKQPLRSGFVQLHPFAAITAQHMRRLPGLQPTEGAIRGDPAVDASAVGAERPAVELNLLPETGAELYPALLAAVQDAVARNAAQQAAWRGAAAGSAEGATHLAALEAAAGELAALAALLGDSLHPNRLFRSTELLTLRAARRYAAALVECLQRLGAADPAAAAALVARTSAASAAAVTHASDSLLATSQRRYIFAHLPELVADLQRSGRLPALLFHFSKTDLNRMQRYLLMLLHLREEAWKAATGWGAVDKARYEAEMKRCAAEAEKLRRRKRRTPDEDSRLADLDAQLVAGPPDESAIVPRFTYAEEGSPMTIAHAAEALGISSRAVQSMVSRDIRELEADLVHARSEVMRLRGGGAGAADGEAAGSGVGGGHVSTEELLAFLAADCGASFAPEPLLCLGLMRGLGVHHGSLRRRERQGVETLFRERRVRVLFAARELSQGINMPCRTVCLVGESPELDAMMFRQLSGRAGRRGFDNRGDVVFFAFREATLHRLLNGMLDPPQATWPAYPSALLRTGIRRSAALLPSGAPSPVPALASEGALFTQALARLVRHSFASFVGGSGELRGHSVWSQPGATLLAGRFALDFLRRQGFLDSQGMPTAAAALPAYLAHAEPAALVLAHLLRSGALAQLVQAAMAGAAAGSAADPRLCKITRSGASRYFAKDVSTSEAVQATAGSVDNALLSLFAILFEVRLAPRSGPAAQSALRVADLPAPVAEAVGAYNSGVLTRYTAYLRAFALAARAAAASGAAVAAAFPPALTSPQATLPLSGIAVPLRAPAASGAAATGPVPATVLGAVRRLAAPTLLRSPFDALRGGSGRDAFASAYELLHCLREGLPASPGHLPTLPSLSELVSAYPADFYCSGDLEGVARSNGDSTGSVAQSLRSLGYTIRTVATAATRQFQHAYASLRALASEPEPAPPALPAAAAAAAAAPAPGPAGALPKTLGSWDDSDDEAPPAPAPAAVPSSWEDEAEEAPAPAAAVAAPAAAAAAPGAAQRAAARALVAAARKLPAGTFMDPAALYGASGVGEEEGAGAGGGEDDAAVASLVVAPDMSEEDGAGEGGAEAAEADEAAKAAAAAAAATAAAPAARAGAGGGAAERSQLTTARSYQEEAERLQLFLRDIAVGRLAVTPQEQGDYLTVMALRGLTRRFGRMLEKFVGRE